MIPKIIHYCWFGKNPLNDMAKKCIESWKKYCPDYEIREWNEDNFDISSNTYVKEAYDAKKWAFVTDYVRLYALSKDGGIYMDTDVELIKPLDSLLTHSSFSGFEDLEHIQTAIMGSEPNGEWVNYLLSYYDGKHFVKEDGELDFTTNVTTITNMTAEKYDIKLDNTYQNIDNVLTLYPKDWFCPKDYTTSNLELTDNTVCIHHFNASWHDSVQEFLHEKKLYFINKFGVELGTQKYTEWAEKHRLQIILKKYGVLRFCYYGVRRIIKPFVNCIIKIIIGNNIIAMESLSGFDGNTGAVYEYMMNNPKYKKYKFVWIVKNRDEFLHKTNNRTFVFDKSSKHNTAKSLLLSNAKYLMYDNVPIIKRERSQISIYLTHGCPPLKNVKGLINVPDYNDYVLCPSKQCSEIVSYQFSTDIEKIFICGLPRNDELFSSKDEMSKLIGSKSYNKIILWMPTFRKALGCERNDTNMVYNMGIPMIYDHKQLTDLNNYLAERNCLLILKMHPGQDKDVVKIGSMSNIMLLWQQDIKNQDISLYALMAQTDALVTDYSSVAYDYMLVDKPIGYVIDDMDEYKLGFAFENPYEYMPGHKINTLEEFYSFIEDIVNSRDLYADKRNTILKKTNDYMDGNNTQRFIEYFNL